MELESQKQKMMYAWCDAKGFYYKNMTKTEQVKQEYIPKIDFEHIEGNVRFYFYLYSLAT
jgi:hypothetical protein